MVVEARVLPSGSFAAHERRLVTSLNAGAVRAPNAQWSSGNISVSLTLAAASYDEGELSSF